MCRNKKTGPGWNASGCLKWLDLVTHPSPSLPLSPLPKSSSSSSRVTEYTLGNATTDHVVGVDTFQNEHRAVVNYQTRAGNSSPLRDREAEIHVLVCLLVYMCARMDVSLPAVHSLTCSLPRTLWSVYTVPDVCVLGWLSAKSERRKRIPSYPVSPIQHPFTLLMEARVSSEGGEISTASVPCVYDPLLWSSLPSVIYNAAILLL